MRGNNLAHKLLKTGLISLFCICAAWVIAKIAIYFIVPAPMPAINSQAQARKQTRPVASIDAKTLSGDTVLRRNLFHVLVEPPGGFYDEKGEKMGAAAEAALLREEMEKMPISKQGWTLLGTIVNTLDPPQSRAILVIDNKQSSYPAGAEIKGWKVILIERRTVVVDKNGRRERILVGGKDIESPKASTAATMRGRIKAGEIEEAMRNLPDLMRQTGFAAAQKDGVYGLNLTFVQPDSFISRLGLRQNDLLTGANGKTLTSIGDLAAFGDLARQDSLSLELVRNGKKMTMEYDISR